MSHTARVLCKLCSVQVAIHVDGDPDELADRLIDAETIRRATKAGILPVDLPHIQARSDAKRAESYLTPYKVSVYTTRVWICRTCADCILGQFSFDASVVVQAFNELTTAKPADIVCPPKES